MPLWIVQKPWEVTIDFRWLIWLNHFYEAGWQQFLQDYEMFKDRYQLSRTEYPESLKGKRLQNFHRFLPNFLGLKFQNKFQFVQISISTSTFDRIRKVSKISAISTLFSPPSSGQCSQVCGQAVRHRRHHGAPHGLLHHQRGGVPLLHCQNCA